MLVVTLRYSTAVQYKMYAKDDREGEGGIMYKYNQNKQNILGKLTCVANK